MKRQAFFLILIAVMVLPSFAQYEWEGNAVVAAYGEFPREGNYAASNTFPRNSIVLVTNAETGTQTEVIVTRRLDEPGIFMLLSEGAGDELEIRGGKPVRVRARPSYGTGITAVPPNQDLPFSPDPDINPAAAAADPNAEALQPDSRGPLSTASETPVPTTAPPRASTPPAEVGAVAAVVPEPRRPSAATTPATEEAVTPPTTGDIEPTASPRAGITQGVDNAAGRLIDPDGGDPVFTFVPATPAAAPATPEAVDDTADPGLGTQRPLSPDTVPTVTPVPTIRQSEPVPPAEEPIPGDDGPPPENRIEQALQMVQSRMQKSRLFPAAEEDSVATFMPPRPPREAPLDVGDRLAEAQLHSEEAPVQPPVIVEAPTVPEEPAPVETGPVAADVGPYEAPKEELVASLREAEPRIERPAADHLGQIGAPPEEEPEASELPEAAPIPAEDAVLSLVPAEERPPAGPPVTAQSTEEVAPPASSEPSPSVPAVAAGAGWADRNLPIVKELREEAYYLQVGAYTNPQSAKTALDGLAAEYPTAVLESSVDERRVYRVFVGPLSADEQGTVLYFVRAKGYRDAFIRSGGS